MRAELPNHVVREKNLINRERESEREEQLPLTANKSSSVLSTLKFERKFCFAAF